MATIKSYTDINQSSKLAEILPLESADMEYIFLKENNIAIGNVPFVKDNSEVENSAFDYIYNRTPCWSLAALLSVLPKKYYPIKDHETNLILGKPKDKWCVLYWDATGMQDGEQTSADNPVDACYEMIIHLHKLNLL